MCRSGHESAATTKRHCTIDAHTAKVYDTSRLLSRYGRRAASQPDRRQHWLTLFTKQLTRYQDLTGTWRDIPSHVPTAAHDYTPGNAEWMSDELLEEAYAENTDDELAVLAIMREMDRRDLARQEAEAEAATQQHQRTIEWEAANLNPDVLWARNYLANGPHEGDDPQLMEKARYWANEPDDPVTNPLLAITPRGSARDQMREEYETYVYTQYLRAEEECNGVLLSSRGQAKGVAPQSLFSGPVNRVDAYASDELKAWFNRNGRITQAAYRYQQFGYDSDRAANTRTQLESFDHVANV